MVEGVGLSCRRIEVVRPPPPLSSTPPHPIIYLIDHLSASSFGKDCICHVGRPKSPGIFSFDEPIRMRSRRRVQRRFVSGLSVRLPSENAAPKPGGKIQNGERKQKKGARGSVAVDSPVGKRQVCPGFNLSSSRSQEGGKRNLFPSSIPPRRKSPRPRRVCTVSDSTSREIPLTGS